jgi:maleylpyruvate isomerase
MDHAEETLGCLRSATADLVAAISGLSDSDVRGASLLPGWSRAHILTHLARNAEGGTRLLGWARTGEPSYEYVSLAARAAAIEAGADRTAAALIDDVRQTAEAFSAAATGMPPSRWDREVRWTAGQVTPARLIVPSRWGEVLIHHVDLAIGYQPAHWPAPFTAEFLPLLVASLSGRDAAMEAVRLEATDTGHVFTIGETTPASPRIAGLACELLAWLLGRSGGDPLTRPAGTALPAVPAIY